MQAVLRLRQRRSQTRRQASHVFSLHRADSSHPPLLPVCHVPPCPHPCADMQRTAVQMRAAGFRDVRMFEILPRNMDCAPCEATAAILDEEACASTPRQANHPIKRLREAAQSSAGAGAPLPLEYQRVVGIVLMCFNRCRFDCVEASEGRARAHGISAVRDAVLACSAAT